MTCQGSILLSVGLSTQWHGCEASPHSTWVCCLFSSAVRCIRRNWFPSAAPTRFTSELQAAYHLWGFGASTFLQMAPHQPLLFSFGCSFLLFFLKFLWTEKVMLLLKADKTWNGGDRRGVAGRKSMKWLHLSSWTKEGNARQLLRKGDLPFWFLLMPSFSASLEYLWSWS